MEVKPVVWLGDSLKNLKAFPQQVRKSFGDALYDAQIGKMPPHAKPFKGVGRGVIEIIKRYDSDTYRVVYAVQIANKIYVLHAFQKKAKSGIKTPQQDVDLIKLRYKRLSRPLGVNCIADYKSSAVG